MKKTFLTLVFFLICSVSQADVYIIYNTETKEVKSVQNDDSAVLENGCSKEIIKGKTVDQFPLEYNPLFYKFINNKFVVNTKKLSDFENEKISQEEMIFEYKLIENKSKLIACELLKSEGINFKKVKCDDFK